MCRVLNLNTQPEIVFQIFLKSCILKTVELFSSFRPAIWVIKLIRWWALPLCRWGPAEISWMKEYLQLCIRLLNSVDWKQNLNPHNVHISGVYTQVKLSLWFNFQSKRLVSQSRRIVQNHGAAWIFRGFFSCLCTQIYSIPLFRPDDVFTRISPITGTWMLSVLWSQPYMRGAPMVLAVNTISDVVTENTLQNFHLLCVCQFYYMENGENSIQPNSVQSNIQYES